MLRLKNLSNKYQKRTCRPVYANTQATPYAATLHSTFRNAQGNIQLLNSSTDTLTSRGTAAYRKNDSYLPGMVVVKRSGTEEITIASRATSGSSPDLVSAERPFGLLANFVGGDFDEGFNGDRLQNEVGVWRGPDSVFEILAPAYNDAITASSTVTAGTPLYAGADGRLTSVAGSGTAGGTGQTVVAYLIKKETNRILVDLAI